jgi:hypothetical protein
MKGITEVKKVTKTGKTNQAETGNGQDPLKPQRGQLLSDPDIMHLDGKTNKLMECKSKHEIVAIYDEQENPSHFGCGFVESITDTHVLLSHITRYGEYDGFRVYELKEIFQVVIGGQYTTKLQKLYELKEQSHPTIEVETDSAIINLLRYAKRNRLVIAAELCDSGDDDVQGFVLEIEADNVEIQLLDDYGRPDGTCIVETEKITRLVCDCDKLIAIRLLVENP